MGGFCWLVLGLRLGFGWGESSRVMGIGMIGSLKEILSWGRRDHESCLLESGWCLHKLASVALGRGFENVRRGLHAPKTGAMSALNRMLDSISIVSLSHFAPSTSDLSSKCLPFQRQKYIIYSHGTSVVVQG
jgi:hypothetical protein